MIFIFLFSLIDAKERLCVCYIGCSQSCLFDSFISNTTNYTLNNFHSNEDDIELNFYSPKDNFIVNINLLYFNHKILTFKTLNDSKNIKVRIINLQNSFDKTFDIKPNFEINLNDLISKYSENKNDKLTLLYDPSQTPIPISVPISQMAQKGHIECEQKIGCNYYNLNSPNAYNCGYRCWTYDETSFEYTFLGVKFAVYGTFDKKHYQFQITIDNKESIEIDECNENRREFALLYMSEEMEYKEHTVKISGNKTYEIYKLSYWPSMKSIRLNSTDFKKTGSWYKESDGIGGVQEYTSSGGPTASVSIQCSKIWVFGSKASSHSDLIIQLNDNETTISEYSDKRKDCTLIYESPDFDFGNYELSLKAVGNVVLHSVYYLYDPPDQTHAPFPSFSPLPDQTPDPTMTPTESPTETPIPTPVPISVGLTQMKITGDISCEPSYFNIYNIQNLVCDIEHLDSEKAYKCGYRCWSSKATIEYSFKGVKFELYGTFDSKLGKFNLIIDDDNNIEIDEYKSNRKTHSLIYSSEELEYGYHNIKMTSKGNTYEIYKLTYWPSMIAKRINVTEMSKEGKWSKESDGIGGAREYSKGGSVISTKISFSKIWIYCSKMSWSSDLQIKFGEEEINVSTYSETREDGVLAFESQDYYYDYYNLTIKGFEQTVLFNCIYYIDEPAIPTLSISATETPMPTLTATQSPDPTMTPEPTETPMATPTVSESPTPSFTPYPTITPLPTSTPSPTPVPISIGLTQMDLDGRIYCNIVYFNKDNIQKLGCNINNLESESAYKCGYKCWNYGDANFSYSFKGVKFQLYGTYDPFHQKFNLTIDDGPPIEINEYNEDRYEYVVIFESDELEYKEHKIRIIGIGEIYELYKLAYWPQINAKRLNSTELKKTSSWTKESDGIGGVREYTNKKDATASITLLCTKFWLYSSTCQKHDEIILQIDSEKNIINLNTITRVDSTLVFESDELDYTNHEIKLTSNGTIVIYCIYYLDDPPPPTFTPPPTRTPFFEDNITYIDKVFINYIYTDQINVSEESLIEQISGCKFINIIENSDYLIILEKEIPFYDNSFQYGVNQTKAPSPIITRYNGHLLIYNCTFSYSNSRTKNGCALTCQNDYTIDITVESCKFLNCGNSTNDMIVQILNKDSSINFLNCLFSFDNETTSCKIIFFQSTNINFENCIFYKCGSICVDFQSNNQYFRFVNNYVTSIGQRLLNYISINSNQLISGNIFKDFYCSNESFFYFNVIQNEFELINNTFQNISFNDCNYGGIGLQLSCAENKLTTLFFTNCTFIENLNNYSINVHGGVFQLGYASCKNISVHISNCIFTRNSCLNGYGGALFINIIYDIFIENCTFENNFAELGGNAIYILGNISDDNESELVEKQTVSITNCYFIDNQGSDGNCIYLLEYEINMFCEISFCVFENNGINQQFNIQSSSTIFNYNNNSIICKELINSNYYLILNYSESAEITNSAFINCQTENDSFICISSQNNNIITTMMNCKFIDCISQKSSIMITKGKFDIQNCIFSFSDDKTACSGLEIVSSNSINIIKCKFIKNRNKILNGGVLYIHDETNVLESINLEGILFDSCIGSSYRTLSIELKDYKFDQFKISNITIQNISTGSSIYGINVDTNVLFDHWKFENNQYGNEYGNSYGSYLIPSQHIIFNRCEWIRNYCSDNGGAFGGALYNRINDNKISLLKMKSISFDKCKFIQNSCLGNGGALYLDITAANTITSILNCDFEMNIAFGDCGAIFIKNKNFLLIDSCSFINNTAFKSMSSNEPTDTLYINGNNYVLINNTNFTKGAYLNEITNYQLSHINENANNFNITINFCMFSIINPSKNQLFLNELNNVGNLYILNSKFTHFITQKKYFLSLNSIYDNSKLLDKSIQSDFIYLYQNINIPTDIRTCCFDNNEIMQMSNNELILVNNTINGDCSYPEIVDKIIIDIENYKYPTNNPTNKPIKVTNPAAKYQKDNKMKIIIGSVVGSILFVVITIAIVIAFIIIKIKNNKTELSSKTYEFDEDQDNEMIQESNDSLCSKYDKSLSNIANYYVTQENPLFMHNSMTNLYASQSTSSQSSLSTLSSSSSSSTSKSTSQSNSDFEESRWDESYM